MFNNRIYTVLYLFCFDLLIRIVLVDGIITVVLLCIFRLFSRLPSEVLFCLS